MSLAIRKNVMSHIPENSMQDDVLCKNLVRLEEIRSLKGDWNGYGAKPFPVTVVSQAERIVCGLSRQPEIHPTAQSSIQLEYNSPNGDYLEFEIFDDGRINQFSLKRNGESASRKRVPEDALNEIIEAFYAGC